MSSFPVIITLVITGSKAVFLLLTPLYYPHCPFHLTSRV